MSEFDNESNVLTAGIGASVVRTVVPLIVGAVLAALAKANLDISEDLATEVVTAVVVTLYYAGVRLLEEHVSPKWGWLLGYAHAPRYVGPDASYDPEG